MAALVEEQNDRVADACAGKERAHLRTPCLAGCIFEIRCGTRAKAREGEKTDLPCIELHLSGVAVQKLHL